MLFASDLHLSPQRPDRAQVFFEFLEVAGAHAEAVYLLGDLVEFWLGDDDPDPLHRALVDALNTLTARGVRLSVSVGNRDFLMGPAFCAGTGAALLPDYHVIDLFGRRTLLTHGDLLCVKDVQYQQFRRLVRDPTKQQRFLGQTLEQRRQIASQTRTGTQESMLAKDDFIMDADENEVASVMSAHQVTHLIHGHTHRPQIHHFTLAGQPAQRVVLGDWYAGNEVLWCTPAATSLLPAQDLVTTLTRPTASRK
ncbi:MAG: UDP-2,3-diacylglucosamine diphosphatase [Gammaproteobacteria bacterium]|nr:UDP-2,3-diacylglucosamine diphosphatase [Gammaproteobacteria bacterium]